MKLLGIIGGMSTASSISYYQKINEQINQRLGANHGARLVIYNLDFEEIAQLQKQGNWQQAGEMLADAAKRLVLAGVDGILVSIRPTPIAFSKHEAGAHQYPYFMGRQTFKHIRQVGINIQPIQTSRLDKRHNHRSTLPTFKRSCE